MDLDDRKLKILNAVVNDYILTAEPIGSRTIEKKYNLGVSAATIRNEMSDLEELGFLVAPHTSAGRVPSDKGFRLYVDNIIQNRANSSVDSLQELIFDNISKIENLMEETAKAISSYTNYATFVTEESFIAYRIKRIQLVPIDDDSVLLVMIFDKNIVKNEYLDIIDIIYSVEYFERLTAGLNLFLSGVLIDDLTSEIIESIVDYVNDEFDYNNYIIKEIIERIVLQGNAKKDTKVYKSGINNILEYPEFYNNASRVKHIFESFEQNEFISNLLLEDDNFTNEDVKFDIIIGEENNDKDMKDLTVLKVRYKIEEGKYGNIGIIGPKRMNYEQTIAVLNSIVKNINKGVKSIDCN